jgi:hypothetical protein
MQRGNTALIKSAGNGDKAIVNMILENAEVDVNTHNKVSHKIILLLF